MTMVEITLNKATHQYTVDGEKLPSVSDLTRFLSREIYREVDAYTLDRAAARGTAVHEACEALDEYGKVQASEENAPYIKAYADFVREHRPEWTGIEKAICHPEKIYAGTLDRVGTLDGKTTLLDIKTTANIDRGHKTVYTAQLNLYRFCLETPPEQMIILQLKKDGTYKLINIDVDEELANACITLHKRLEKKPRKRKDENNG